MVEQKRHAVDFGILLGSLTRASSISCAPISRGAASTIWAGLMDMSSGPWPRRSRASASWRDGLQDHRQGMAKIIAEMVERRYVERKPDPHDSRVKRLRLGPRGRAALAAARRFHHAFEIELGRSLGKPAVRQLRGMRSGRSQRSADLSGGGRVLRRRRISGRRAHQVQRPAVDGKAKAGRAAGARFRPRERPAVGAIRPLGELRRLLLSRDRPRPFVDVVVPARRDDRHAISPAVLLATLERDRSPRLPRPGPRRHAERPRSPPPRNGAGPPHAQSRR